MNMGGAPGWLLLDLVVFDLVSSLGLSNLSGIGSAGTDSGVESDP